MFITAEYVIVVGITNFRTSVIKMIMWKTVLPPFKSVPGSFIDIRKHKLTGCWIF